MSLSCTAFNVKETLLQQYTTVSNLEHSFNSVVTVKMTVHVWYPICLYALHGYVPFSTIYLRFAIAEMTLKVSHVMALTDTSYSCSTVTTPLHSIITQILILVYELGDSWLWKWAWVKSFSSNTTVQNTCSHNLESERHTEGPQHTTQLMQPFVWQKQKPTKQKNIFKLENVHLISVPVQIGDPIRGATWRVML